MINKIANYVPITESLLLVVISKVIKQILIFIPQVDFTKLAVTEIIPGYINRSGIRNDHECRILSIPFSRTWVITTGLFRVILFLFFFHQFPLSYEVSEAKGA